MKEDIDIMNDFELLLKILGPVENFYKDRINILYDHHFNNEILVFRVPKIKYWRFAVTLPISKESSLYIYPVYLFDAWSPSRCFYYKQGIGFSIYMLLNMFYLFQDNYFYMAAKGLTYGYEYDKRIQRIGNHHYIIMETVRFFRTAEIHLRHAIKMFCEDTGCKLEKYNFDGETIYLDISLYSDVFLGRSKTLFNHLLGLIYGIRVLLTTKINKLYGNKTLDSFIEFDKKLSVKFIDEETGKEVCYVGSLNG